MRGRPPKPTALKEISGNPGHRPLNKDEPELPIASISAQPPPTMNDAAREVWHAHIGQLTTSKVLTTADIPIFVAYCNYYAEYLKYDAQVENDGAFAMIPRLGKDGKPTGTYYTEYHPARVMRDAAYEKFRKAAAEIGVTPSARSRVKKDTSPDSTATSLEQIRARLRA